MSQSSPRAELPYLQAAQAQKHVTHNEALQRLDALTQLCLRQRTSNSPPAQPAAGDLYGIGSTPSGAWAGQAGAIAYWTGTSWLFLQPQEGWRAWDLSTQALRVWRVEEGGVGGSWQPSFALFDQLDGLGLGTVSDAQITLTPQRRDDRLVLSRQGDRLTLNGELFDFTTLPEGASLPRRAVACPWLTSDVTRIAGTLQLSLILPHGAQAPEATLFPAPISLTQDGPVTLPPYEIEDAT